jgi:RNA polymerase sigma-70 factor (ECF subfamily)
VPIRPASQEEPSAVRNHLRVLEWHGSEAELLESVMSGAPGSAERLFDRFAPDINRVVWKLLGADADHDDIVHDVFVKVWRLMSAGRVNKPESLGSWVVAVAVHTVQKEIRRRTVRRRLLGAEARHAPFSETVDVEARQLLGRVYEILEKLPSAERVAFTLRHLDQRQLAEVSELMGCSLATTKRRLKRAEQRFCTHAQRYPALAPLLGRTSWAGGGQEALSVDAGNSDETETDAAGLRTDLRDSELSGAERTSIARPRKDSDSGEGEVP